MKNLHPLNWIQWLTLALAVTLAVCAPIFYWRLVQVQHRIQQERYDAVISSCEDQNHRHDATIRQLELAADRSVRAGEQSRASANHGVAVFKLILGAATPHRNCQALVRKYVNQK